MTGTWPPYARIGPAGVVLIFSLLMKGAKRNLSLSAFYVLKLVSVSSEGYWHQSNRFHQHPRTLEGTPSLTMGDPLAQLVNTSSKVLALSSNRILAEHPHG
eukprot:157940-Prorocentrum_minimum.AAC.4